MHLPNLLCPARVHEATGGGRRAFALALAGELAGPMLWVLAAAALDGLYAPGIATFLDPARLIVARPPGPLPVLQATEEALRSGVAPLVVAEFAEAPDLTASRRLQLAARTGGGRGLCLVPKQGLRANAAETRWLAEPVQGDASRQRWEILKNKRGRLGVWEVHRAGRGFVETGRQREAA